MFGRRYKNDSRKGCRDLVIDGHQNFVVTDSERERRKSWYVGIRWGTFEGGIAGPVNQVGVRW